MVLKRMASLLPAAAVLCGLCACGGAPAASSAPTPNAAATPAATAAPEVPAGPEAAYHTAAASFSGGSGTAEDPYQIGTAEELVLFGQVNRDYSSQYNEACYLLTADIALNDVSGYSTWDAAEPEYRWEPVDGRFQGVFDGGGHTVSGLYVSAAGEEYRGGGLFGTLNNATVRNLDLAQAYLAVDGADLDGKDVGCLAGSAVGCLIEDCTVDGTIRMEAFPSRAGGVAGSALNSTISGCRFTGSIDGHACSGNTGGIVGSLGGYDGSGVLTDCSSGGTLQLRDSGLGTAGGVAGYTGDGCVVRGCVNQMDLSGEASSLGGVIGTVSVSYESTLEDGQWVYRGGAFEASGCTNEGSVDNRMEDGQTGGVIGHVFSSDSRGESLRLSQMTNNGSVSGIQRVGGVIGELDSGYLLYTIQDCENQGQVTGESQAGGIIGWMGSCVDGCQIAGCSNSGGVTAASPSGGIIGGYFGTSLLTERGEGQLTLRECVNSGTVENLDGISGTGGILGQLHMDSEGEAVLLTGCRNTGTVRSAGPAWMGGILGGASVAMQGGSWTIRDCQSSGVLSFGTGTRDFAKDAGSELDFAGSSPVDPASMSEAEYQESLESRVFQTLGGSCVGGIAGKLWMGTIEKCTSTGTILLDGTSVCYTGGICGQFYNAGGANGSSIRDCQYREDWPFAAMAAVGGLEDLPEGAMADVTASIKAD